MNKGVFITFEGPEGSGKTTQANLLCDNLEKKGLPILHTREPGGTVISEKIRALLLDPGNIKMEPTTELLLYAASRAQHVEELIRPFLAKGGVVICDRFSDATVAYQGYGRQLDMKLIKALNGIATGGLDPDITFLLDIPTEDGLRKAIHTLKQYTLPGQGDRMEQAGLEFHKRVRSGYIKLAKNKKRNIKTIDATASIEEIHSVILNMLEPLIKGPGK